VPAFRRLADELERLGASALARRARDSARDEVRHTRLMRELAGRYGAAARAVLPVTPPACTRSPFEIAREITVEGCGARRLERGWRGSRPRSRAILPCVRSCARSPQTRHGMQSSRGPSPISSSRS